MAYADCYTPNYVPTEMEKANAVKLLLETAKLNGLEITTSLYMELISKVYVEPIATALLAEETQEIMNVKEMTTTTIYK